MNMLAIMLATTVNFTTQTACHPEDFKHYDTATMRSRFVMEKVMAPDEINLTYTMYDRFVYVTADCCSCPSFFFEHILYALNQSVCHIYTPV